VIVARGPDGDVATYPVFENAHAHHVLDVTVVPARVAPALRERAEALAVRVAEALDLVGLACVECFVLEDGDAARERDRAAAAQLRPRHDRGLRDRPVRAAAARRVRPAARLHALRAPGAMANLLGDLWQGGTPDWERALALPGLHLHLYGKRAARAGRKMGHLSALADDPTAPRRWCARAATRCGAPARRRLRPEVVQNVAHMTPTAAPCSSEPRAPRATRSPAARGARPAGLPGAARALVPEPGRRPRARSTAGAATSRRWWSASWGSSRSSTSRRPEPLKLLDLERDLSPDWFQREHMVGYVCYVERFAGTPRGRARARSTTSRSSASATCTSCTCCARARARTTAATPSRLPRRRPAPGQRSTTWIASAPRCASAAWRCASTWC
jgi:hypothetical protein